MSTANNISKVLVVAPDFPFPPTYGGAADIWGRILILKSMGFVVDLICSPKEEPQNNNLEFVKRTINTVITVARKNRIIDLLAKQPLQVASRKSLQNYTFEYGYDLVLLESEYVGSILENVSLKYKYAALRVHNNEAYYFKSLFKSSSGIARYYYALESFKFARYQKEISQKINNYIFISKDECSSFSASNPSSKKVVYHLPPSTKNICFQRPLTSRNVLFVGSLFMPNNLEALYWYLEHVHPLLKAIDDYKLVIVGSTKGKSNSYLEQLSTKDETIIYQPDAEDLDQIYENASIFVNPMRHGAGVKMKSIHAIQEGLPVVSTSIGMEGTGLLPDTHYKLADSSVEFVEAIQFLFSDIKHRNQIVKRAQSYITIHYDHASVLRSFFSDLIPAE